MNIFFLSMSVKRCARYHVDKNVIKMIIECCQLLCTAMWLLDPIAAGTIPFIYKPTHINHPCAKWVRQHIHNYNYVARLGLQLCQEWRHRYQHEKRHGCEDCLIYLYHHPPASIPTNDVLKTINNPKQLILPLPQAMPLCYKSTRMSVHTTIKAYRRYYQS